MTTAVADAEQRTDRRTGAGALGLERRVEEQCGLEALAPDGQQRGGEHADRADLDGGRHLVLQLALECPRRPLHPEDHPRHEHDRDDREDAAEGLPGLEAHRRRGVVQQCTEAEGQCHGDRDTGPQGRDAVAVAAADHERHQDAHDEGSFEPLAESGQECLQHVDLRVFCAAGRGAHASATSKLGHPNNCCPPPATPSARRVQPHRRARNIIATDRLSR